MTNVENIADCGCSETRISYTRPDGMSAIAPVSYRCARHRNFRRVQDDKRRTSIAATVAYICTPMPTALPAPRALLT